MAKRICGQVGRMVDILADCVVVVVVVGVDC